MKLSGGGVNILGGGFDFVLERGDSWEGPVYRNGPAETLHHLSMKALFP